MEDRDTSGAEADRGVTIACNGLVAVRSVAPPAGLPEFETRIKFYSRSGERISFWLAGTLGEDAGYRQLALSTLNGYTVSTIWLGLSSLLDGCLFETAICSLGIEVVARYATEKEALIGHDVVCAHVWRNMPAERPLIRGELVAGD